MAILSHCRFGPVTILRNIYLVSSNSRTELFEDLPGFSAVSVLADGRLHVLDHILLHSMFGACGGSDLLRISGGMGKRAYSGNFWVTSASLVSFRKAPRL